MIEGVVISPLNKAGENDNGSTYTFESNRMGELMLGYRKAGSVSGRHWHEGYSVQKNPEILLLLQGEARLTVRNIFTKQGASEHIKAPCRVEIYPNVWHAIEAVTDITFLELNSISQHASDTKYGE